MRQKLTIVWWFRTRAEITLPPQTQATHYPVPEEQIKSLSCWDQRSRKRYSGSSSSLTTATPTVNHIKLELFHFILWSWWTGLCNNPSPGIWFQSFCSFFLSCILSVIVNFPFFFFSPFPCLGLVGHQTFFTVQGFGTEPPSRSLWSQSKFSDPLLPQLLLFTVAPFHCNFLLTVLLVFSRV